MTKQTPKIQNIPLGTEPVNKLLQQFAIPSIIAMLVSALYNIVDQFFIGRSVGELGNAATTISFPLSISCVAIALLFGIGGASYRIGAKAGDVDTVPFGSFPRTMIEKIGGMEKVILAEKDKNLQSFRKFMDTYGGF